MRYARTEPTTPKPETVIWRYMDDLKFTDLLKKFVEHDKWQTPKPGTRTLHINEPGQLWFGFPSSFEDVHEGTFPGPNKSPNEYCDRMAEHKGLSVEEAKSLKERFLGENTAELQNVIFCMAQMCGVSCWHANDVESSDMWHFAPESNGVAIRSTCQQVESALAYAQNSPARRATPSLCAVGYIDHANFFLPADGFRSLLSIIQESFSYESEVRFVAKSAELGAVPTAIKTPLSLDAATWSKDEPTWASMRNEYIADISDQVRKAYSQLSTAGQVGFHLPIALDGLISEVVLKNGCEADYEEAVRDQLKQAGCSHVPIRHSSLA